MCLNVTGGDRTITICRFYKTISGPTLHMSSNFHFTAGHLQETCNSYVMCYRVKVSTGHTTDVLTVSSSISRSPLFFLSLSAPSLSSLTSYSIGQVGQIKVYRRGRGCVSQTVVSTYSTGTTPVTSKLHIVTNWALPPGEKLASP